MSMSQKNRSNALQSFTQMPRIEAQGHLITTYNPMPQVEENSNAEGTKQPITHFSRKSRTNLMRLFHRLDLKHNKAVFLTLTYPWNQNEGALAKVHLKAFLMRVRRNIPRASGIWRLEYQERGAAHFHLILFNFPFLQVKIIRQWWDEIIYAGDLPEPRKTTQINIKMVKSWREVISYVAKYLTKTTGDSKVTTLLAKHIFAIWKYTGYKIEWLGLLVYLIFKPYQHAGRFWGVINKSGLPFAPLLSIEIEERTKAFWDFRRGIRRALNTYWDYKKKERRKKDRKPRYAKTCSVFFSENAYNWLDYWDYLVGRGVYEDAT